ncbi:type IV secretion system DNA-binding domain-containing protein [bacterium]|nr:type IV secretion system DNA-binding domain-containing protein [bacterium]
MFNKNQVTYFAETDFRNARTRFGIKREDRTRHLYVIGKTGMGKSTMLENMAVQDIQNNNGMGFIDPHGKTADLLLDYIPEHRMQDVVYFAPFDLDHPMSFNIMEDVGYDKRHLVVSGLVSAFKKIWVDQFSARMEYILSNILFALLEYPDATLLGVNRMMVDKAYRKKVVDNIKDPSVKSFWVDEFAKYTDRYTQEATPAIQNKIGQFTSNPLIRNLVGQPKSSFDIRDIMDKGKILIMNLSKGRMGEVNSNIVGSMLITKIYLSAMSRADLTQGELNRLPEFFFFVDEFQSFANETFADILSEARKYKLALTLAHQYIEQMPEEVRAAVFGNIGTMVTFRVGAFDAEILEKEFMPQFTQEDLVNLGFAQIYLKLMIDGVSSKPFSATTLPPIEPPEISMKERVISFSRKEFAKPRVAVEDAINKWYEPIPEEPREERGEGGMRSGGFGDDRGGRIGRPQYGNSAGGRSAGGSMQDRPRPYPPRSQDEARPFSTPPRRDYGDSRPSPGRGFGDSRPSPGRGFDEARPYSSRSENARPYPPREDRPRPSGRENFRDVPSERPQEKRREFDRRPSESPSFERRRDDIPREPMTEQVPPARPPVRNEYIERQKMAQTRPVSVASIPNAFEEQSTPAPPRRDHDEAKPLGVPSIKREDEKEWESLENLKRNARRDAKRPTDEHMKSLKEAIEEAMKEKQNLPGSPSINNATAKVDESPKAPPREIPEDVLKNMFEPDDR